MDSPILVELLVAIASIVGAALLGHFLQRGCGTVLFALATALAFGLCMAGTALAGWPGLLAATSAVGLFGFLIGRKLLGISGAQVISLLWAGFSLACIAGYWIGGGFGVLAVALPSVLLFWSLLYVLSGVLLPLSDPSQRALAFRSLLTFSLGTNYPYYVMNGRDLEERVPGNPYRSFFAGPGIVITGADHLPVLTTGTEVTVPEAPGITFTGRFEVVQRTIDLRPQLRTFHVEARARDGIPIRVQCFLPFRIGAEGRMPTLGQSFPFDRNAVFQAVTHEMVEDRRKHNWDDLVEIHAAQILRDVVARYEFDELCLALGPCVGGQADIIQRYAADSSPSPHNPARDPRYRIRDEIVCRVRKEMQGLGIEVLGGGIGNLTPIDGALIEQRIANWRTRWQARIRAVEASREAARIKTIDGARLGVEHKLLITVAKFLSKSLADGVDMSEELLVASYVASLQRMADARNVKELIDPDTRQKLAYLRSLGRPVMLSSAVETEPWE